MTAGILLALLRLFVWIVILRLTFWLAMKFVQWLRSN